MTQQVFAYKHVFWSSFDGRTGDEYTMYTNCHYTHLSSDDYILITDSRLTDIIENLKRNNSGATVPKGSSIYLSPNCPYAVNDVRHHYTLKRKPDTGDYNVISIIKNRRNTRVSFMDFSHAFIVPDRKILVVLSYPNYYKKDTVKPIDIIRNFCPDFNSNVTPISEIEIMPLYLCMNSSVVIDYMLGRLHKPCVYYTALDITNNVELTLDFLTLLYNTGNKRKWDRAGRQDFLTELKVLNQHNWRDYLGTLTIMFYYLFNINSIAVSFRNNLSYCTKEVREIFRLISSNKGDDFVSEKDFNMTKLFIDSLLHIGDLKFATLENLCDKLKSNNLSISIFSRLFDNIVKITPKAYVQKGK